MSLLKKIKGFFDFKISDLDINPETENEMIENISEKISRAGMEMPALLFGYAYLPMSTIVTQMTLLPLSPVLEAFGIPGFKYVAFFENKDTLKRLLNRIENLQKDRESKE